MSNTSLAGCGIGLEIEAGCRIMEICWDVKRDIKYNSKNRIRSILKAGLGMWDLYMGDIRELKQEILYYVILYYMIG